MVKLEKEELIVLLDETRRLNETFKNKYYF